MIHDSENWNEEPRISSTPKRRIVVKKRYRLKKQAYFALIGVCFVLGGLTWGVVKTAHWGYTHIRAWVIGETIPDELEPIALTSIPLALTNPNARVLQMEEEQAIDSEKPAVASMGVGELAGQASLNLAVIPQGSTGSENLYSTQSVQAIEEPKTATLEAGEAFISPDGLETQLTGIEWVEGESSTERNGLKFFFAFTNQSQESIILGTNHNENEMPIIMTKDTVLGVHTQGVETLSTNTAPEMGYSSTRYLVNFHVGYTEPLEEKNCNIGVSLPAGQTYTCYELVDDAGIGMYWTGFPNGQSFEWAKVDLTNSDQILETEKMKSTPENEDNLNDEQLDENNE